MSEQVVQIEDLYFSYGEQTVLDGVNLSVSRGEFLGIMGPNGSGKSTLMRLILGLLPPQKGNIYVFGQPVYPLKKHLRIGYVSQKVNHFNLGFPATVREVVASGLTGRLGLFRWMSKSDWAFVEQMIEQVGLTPWMHRNMGKLSGGQQQRAFMARALVHKPELLILDEPTVGVDVKSTRQFYQLLTSLHQNQRLTLILVTHDISVVSTYVNRVACLNKKLFFHGDPDDFVEKQQEILSAVYDHEVQVVRHDHL
jgi:zinc transport system ATP-binding protein